MILELLNIMTNKNIQEKDFFISKDHYLNYSYYEENQLVTSKINIHEFVYRLKIWSFVMGYEIVSGTISEDDGGMTFTCSIYDKNAESVDEYYFLIDFDAGNEPEVIIKACEWILENLKENKSCK